MLSSFAGLAGALVGWMLAAGTGVPSELKAGPMWGFGLVVGALTAQLSFILSPPDTDDEWAFQRRWSITAVSLAVALATFATLYPAVVTFPILAAVIPASTLGQLLLSLAAGAITAGLDHLFWSAVNPPPSSRPKPQAPTKPQVPKPPGPPPRKLPI